MNSKIPIQFRLPPPNLVRVVVTREKTNQFLAALWDILNEEIGPISCTHRYAQPIGSKNPELYEYLIEWLINGVFIQISFFNNTSKGIRDIHVSVADEVTGVEDHTVLDVITKSIKRAENQINQERGIESPAQIPTALVRVPLVSLYPLSGLYELGNFLIYPSSLEPSRNVLLHRLKQFFLCILEFTTVQHTHSQRIREAHEKAYNIAAALSLITQNIFLPQIEEITLFQPSATEQQKKFIQNSIQGLFTDDDGMFGDVKANDDGVYDHLHTKEILEADDVIFDRHFRLPRYTAQALSIVLQNQIYCQSARRFQEGMRLSLETLYHPSTPTLGFLITPYQLIAFVAAIESLLETSPKKIICPSCGNSIQTQDREISKTFVSFIEKYLGQNEVTTQMFKQLYQDRSKFVHTGKDLYDPLALLGNNPLVLDGKNSKLLTPRYYFNIGELTGLAIRKHIYSFIDRQNHEKTG